MFKFNDFHGKTILTSSLIEDKKEVTAFFTTRDLSLKDGGQEDMTNFVEESKKFICEKLNIPLKNLIIPVQTHSDNIGIITSIEETFDNTDALITNIPNIAIGLNFADCVPIIFYDESKKVVACAHAGWRGTVQQIGIKTVQKMIERYNSKPEDIIALIGASIGKCCFEVKEDVMEKIKNSIPQKFHTEEVFSDNKVDLKLVNKIQLSNFGIKKIDVCENCTSCSNDLFYSYRKENGKCARHSAIIMLKENK